MAPDPNSASGSGTTRDEASVKVTSKDPKKKDEKKYEDLVSSLICLVASMNFFVFALELLI